MVATTSMAVARQKTSLLSSTGQSSCPGETWTGGTTSTPTTTPENPRVCTQEVKQCPDGSYVGRVGPNCEFKQCPNPDTTPGGVGCTRDARLCPDGSYVGRVGPRCEFKQCPKQTKPISPRPLQQLKDTRNEIKAEIKTVRSDAKTEIEDLRERMASSTRQIRDQEIGRAHV